MSFYETQLYPTPTGVEIHLPTALNDEPVRVTYTALHSQMTLRGEAIEAVACYAAAILCDQLATRYAPDTHSTISADSVNHASKSINYAARARALRQSYASLLKLDETRLLPASAVVNWNLSDSRGFDRQTHSNRYR